MKALVIVGHGSHLNGDSSLPIYEHAARIREMGLFDEVVAVSYTHLTLPTKRIV